MGTMREIAMLVRSFARDEEGATMVEYGIMLVLIAAISIVVVIAIGQHVNTEFQLLNGLF
jgi:pilus assembly protein Flp/PilA